MTGLTQWLGFVKKELVLQGEYRLALLSRLLIGPTTNAVTAWAIYAGVFRMNGGHSLAGLNRHNYAVHLTFGFLVHAFLNSGFYFFPLKVATERNAGTLPLIWSAEGGILSPLLAFATIEGLKCGLLTVVCVLFIPAASGFHPGTWALFVAVFLLLFIFSMLIGCFKSVVWILNEGWGEILNQMYLGFIFLTCPYIPRELLPAWLQPICQMNPAYHAVVLLRGLWSGEPGMGAHAVALASGTCLLAGALTLIWLSLRSTLRELTLS